MATSDAKIRANQANSAKSTGPKTAEGKEASRQNALKHGLTGSGVVMKSEDAAEVEQLIVAFIDELQPSGSLGLTLVKRAATLAVRMEKCAEREMAATARRMARAAADFEAPEGADPAEVTRLRREAADEAAFDPSKEADLARRYEAAAERGFYRAIRELRLVEKQAKLIEPADEVEPPPSDLGSFLQTDDLEAGFAAQYPHLALPDARKPLEPYWMNSPKPANGAVDVAITIGRPR